jgi:hypothetical protein
VALRSRTRWQLVALATIGCAPEKTYPERTRVALVEPAPFRPGPAPQRTRFGVVRAEDNADCVRCHQTIAAEWAGSLHAHSYMDPVVQEALAVEPTPFCRGCHAPESDQERVPSDEEATLGVACVTCHGTLDSVWNPTASGRAPHAVHSVAQLATSDACAGCHEFGFPLRPTVAMQATVSEHESSELADTPCQNCHMAEVVDAAGRRHRRHDFRVQGDAALIGSAVSVRAERDGERGVRFRLAADRVGHAVPTGDLFRRLELHAEALDDAGQVIETTAPVSLMRSFSVTLGPHGPDRVPVADTRVPPPGAGAMELGVHFRRDVSAIRVRWQLRYFRMSDSLYELFGVDAQADALLLHEGHLP